MNAETLLKTLRHCMSPGTVCSDCPNHDFATGTCAEEIETLAINVIESLLAQLAEKETTVSPSGKHCNNG